MRKKEWKRKKKKNTPVVPTGGGIFPQMPPWLYQCRANKKWQIIQSGTTWFTAAVCQHWEWLSNSFLIWTIKILSSNDQPTQQQQEISMNWNVVHSGVAWCSSVCKAHVTWCGSSVRWHSCREPSSSDTRAEDPPSRRSLQRGRGEEREKMSTVNSIDIAVQPSNLNNFIRLVFIMNTENFHQIKKYSKLRKCEHLFNLTQAKQKKKKYNATSLKIKLSLMWPNVLLTWKLRGKKAHYCGNHASQIFTRQSDFCRVQLPQS